MKLWLSPEILNWNISLLHPESSSTLSFLEPYDLIKHAKKRIDEAEAKDGDDSKSIALGEAVIHLRSAVENREKQLVKKFNLKELSFGSSSKKDNIRVSEKLRRLEIIQPILLKNLIDLRNVVIHEQKYPLNTDKVKIKEYYEVAWYFLRSTDSFLSRSISGMRLCHPDVDTLDFFDEETDESCFLVTCAPEHNWEISFQGVEVPITLFSKGERKNWLELLVKNFDDSNIYEEELGINWASVLIDSALKAVTDSALKKEKMTSISDVVIDENRKKRIDKYFSSNKKVGDFSGTLIGPTLFMNYIKKSYFDMYMYY